MIPDSSPAQQRPALRCPRCDSTNTKFCYYNNYSLSQPRHFCKSCRRYWTHGGALRSVPVGGASRKSKRPRRSSQPLLGFQPSFTGYNPSGLALNPALPPPTTSQGGDGVLASSIESLSSLNQELHWKLQHHRMSLLFDHNNTHHPIFFHNLDPTNSFPHPNSSRGTHRDQSNNSPNNNNQWFYDTPYGSSGGGGVSGGRNNSCIDGTENDESENVAGGLSSSGGYVLDKDGVIKFQQYGQWIGMKKT